MIAKSNTHTQTHTHGQKNWSRFIDIFTIWNCIHVSRCTNSYECNYSVILLFGNSPLWSRFFLSSVWMGSRVEIYQIAHSIHCVETNVTLFRRFRWYFSDYRNRRWDYIRYFKSANWCQRTKDIKMNSFLYIARCTLSYSLHQFYSYRFTL